MSTPCNIAVKTGTGYKTIYCHWDGYPSHMYPMLRDWYGTPERAEALVNFGDASSINHLLVPPKDSDHSFAKPDRDTCVFYHRDRGEGWDDVSPWVYTREQLFNLQRYVYIFEDGQWKAYVNGQEVADYDF